MVLAALLVLSPACSRKSTEKTAIDPVPEDSEPVGPGPTTVGESNATTTVFTTTTLGFTVVTSRPPPTTTTTLTPDQKKMAAIAAGLKPQLPAKVAKVRVTTLKPALTVDLFVPASTPEAEMIALLRKAWSLLGADKAENYSIALLETDAALPAGLAQLTYYAPTGLVEIRLANGKTVRESIPVPKP